MYNSRTCVIVYGSICGQILFHGHVHTGVFTRLSSCTSNTRVLQVRRPGRLSIKNNTSRQPLVTNGDDIGCMGWWFHSIATCLIYFWIMRRLSVCPDTPCMGWGQADWEFDSHHNSTAYPWSRSAGQTPSYPVV